MGSRRRRLRLPAVISSAVLAVLAMSPAVTRADLLATLEVRSQAGTDLDLATFNIATRARLTGPGVNTSANELHPSMAGNRLAFERLQGSTVSVIVTDLSTGTQAVVLRGAIARGRPAPPSDPALVLNGSALITGHASNASCPGLTSTRLSAFPGGPFPSSAVGAVTACLGGETTTTLEPLVVGSNPLDVLFAVDCCGFPNAEVPNLPRSIHRITGQQQTGSLSLPVTCSGSTCAGESVQDPAMSPGGAVLVFEVVGPQVHVGDPAPGLYSTSSTPASSGQFGPVTELPAAINGAPEARETRPAFSADGRFLAFVRHDQQSGREHLFVWDSQTQLLLDSAGIDLGTLNGSPASLVLSHGNVVLVNHPVLRRSSVSRGGGVSFDLASASDIGVIVQKVVGRTRVFGRPAPRLRFLGRVPLGHFARGRGHTVWDLKVGGNPLAPGLYQVTVRSVTSSGGVRDVGRPDLIRIGAHP
jgi:hypothetical protein